MKVFNGTLEVGKEYELNNGEVHKCGEMFRTDPKAKSEAGFGPFLIDGCCYQENGVFGTGTINDKNVRGHAVGTLAELGVKPGDVVEHVTFGNGKGVSVKGHLTINAALGIRKSIVVTFGYHDVSTFRIISRAEHTAKTDDISKFSNWERVEGEGSGLYAFVKYRISAAGVGKYGAYMVTAPGEQNYILAQNVSKADAHEYCVRHSLGDVAKPTLFGELTDAKKGALLLAEHNGETIERRIYGGMWTDKCDPSWGVFAAYRVKPKPVVKTVVMPVYYRDEVKPLFDEGMSNPTHRLTFDVIDGEPTNPRFEKLSKEGKK